MGTRWASTDLGALETASTAPPIQFSKLALVRVSCMRPVQPHDRSAQNVGYDPQTIQHSSRPLRHRREAIENTVSADKHQHQHVPPMIRELDVFQVDVLQVLGSEDPVLKHLEQSVESE